MKTIVNITGVIATGLLFVLPLSAQAQTATCSGHVNIENMDIGCDGEATQIVSLADCDFRSGKTPDVRLFNVIDGRIGNQSVSIVETKSGSFQVLIRPLPSMGNSSVCKVSRFDWEAE